MTRPTGFPFKYNDQKPKTGQAGSFKKPQRTFPKNYGTINRNLFSQLRADAKISNAMRRAKKSVSKRAAQSKAGEFGIQIHFDPEVFLMNPLEDVNKYLAGFLGINLSYAIRDRVVLDAVGPDGNRMGPYFNTGGMWQGFDAKAQGDKKATAQFNRTSYSSNIVTGYLRRNSDLTLKELKSLFRKRRAKSVAELKGVAGIGKVKGWDPSVRNRHKAYTCQTKGNAGARGILEPSQGEVDAIMAYLHDLLELRTMIGDVSHVPEKLRQVRARRLVKALGKIKAPQIRIN